MINEILSEIGWVLVAFSCKHGIAKETKEN